MDQRYRELAKLMVTHSTSVQPGEKVLIEVSGAEDGFAAAVIKAVYEAGGKPFYQQTGDPLQAAWLRQADEDSIKMQAAWDRQRMSEMDVYISIRLKDNLYEFTGVPARQNELYSRLHTGPVHFETRVPGTKWVVTRFPNASMAQLACMSTEEFADFYFRCSCMDYAEFARLMEPLAGRLNRASQVQIKGQNVDLSFSIDHMPAVICAGERNLPDGEVYTAPHRESVEGSIRYNTPSPYAGQVFEEVSLRFQKGKIVEARCGDKEDSRLTSIFDTDPGARYIGEFALGLNPYIEHTIKDILFDEKVSGSFHFTPGNICSGADNGNRSAIHWDLVYLMHQQYGGCEILLDGELMQKDGRFIPAELQILNPENLIPELKL